MTSASVSDRINTPSSPTKSLGFGGFDSSRLSILRGRQANSDVVIIVVIISIIIMIVIIVVMLRIITIIVPNKAPIAWQALHYGQFSHS